MATTSKKTSKTTAETDAGPAAQETPPDYGASALLIGTDARALAETTRAALDDLGARCADLNQIDPGPHTAAADAVRRVAMAFGDLDRAVSGLAGAAADLAAAARR